MLKVKSISIFLLCIFSSIHLISFACDLVDFSHNLYHFAKSHDIEHNHHNHDHSSQPNDKKEDDNCCEDITNVFFQGIELILTDIHSSYYSFIQYILEFDYEEQHTKNNSYEKFFKIRPPPYVNQSFSIRVIIQSFQI